MSVYHCTSSIGILREARAVLIKAIGRVVLLYKLHSGKSRQLVKLNAGKNEAGARLPNGVASALNLTRL